MSTDRVPQSAVVTDLVDAWNRNDPGGFAACFHERCEFTTIFGDRAEGRDAIERMHVYPWSSTGDRTPDGQELPPRNGIIVLVLTREDGSWRITTGHNLDVSGVYRPVGG